MGLPIKIALISFEHVPVGLWFRAKEMWYIRHNLTVTLARPRGHDWFRMFDNDSLVAIEKKRLPKNRYQYIIEEFDL